MENYLEYITQDKLIELAYDLQDKLEKAEEDVIILRALRYAGVDNWEGTDHAYDLLEEWGYGDYKI